MEFVKMSYWVPKEQTWQSSSKMGPKGVENQKISYISANMTL